MKAFQVLIVSHGDDHESVKTLREHLTSPASAPGLQINTLEQTLLGKEEKSERQRLVKEADLLIVVLSQPFINGSADILDAIKDLGQEARVVNILARPIIEIPAPLSRYQTLPSKTEHIVGTTNEEAQWVYIAKRLLERVRELRQKPGSEGSRHVEPEPPPSPAGSRIYPLPSATFTMLRLARRLRCRLHLYLLLPLLLFGLIVVAIWARCGAVARWAEEECMSNPKHVNCSNTLSLTLWSRPISWLMNLTALKLCYRCDGHKTPMKCMQSLDCETKVSLCKIVPNQSLLDDKVLIDSCAEQLEEMCTPEKVSPPACVARGRHEMARMQSNSVAEAKKYAPKAALFYERALMHKESSWATRNANLFLADLYSQGFLPQSGTMGEQRAKACKHYKRACEIETELGNRDRACREDVKCQGAHFGSGR